MNKATSNVRRAIAAGSLLLSASLLSGCGLGVASYAKYFTDPPKDKASTYDMYKDGFLVEIADRFGLMALFAEVVYRRDLKEEERDEKGCDWLRFKNLPQAQIDFGMPKDDASNGHWERWTPQIEAHREVACANSKGLYYETYVHVGQDQQIDEAVIAFRGTENRNGQMWLDWLNNFKAFFGFEPEQYELAWDRVPKLVAALNDVFTKNTNGKPTRIYAVGHSLGGGLAQQAGYLSPLVSEVYTFNTSPVTNWSWLTINKQVLNGFPSIHRVSNGGEILEKVRFVTTTATDARYGRHDVALQLGERQSVGGHDMKILTCTFAELIAKREDQGLARHHYPAKFAGETVMNQDPNGTEEELRRRICLKKPRANSDQSKAAGT